MSNISYRADVDGLRALAIIPVLLFHVDISGFGGGFVGVDIFFVISGFLITSIIAREIESNSFTFVNFWARRARRILPASILMILGCLIAGWFILAPDDYFDLGRSAREQAYFAGNFYFWKESGYFDGPSELKPLLHTWSLAVEEQFYLFFPLLFIAAHRLFPKHKLPFFIFILLCSLSASIALLKQHPSSTFYLLHTRAWELLAGGLIAIAPTHRNMKPWVCELISILGTAMIFYAIMNYDHTTAFPGSAALLPTLGTAAIIWANTYHKTLVSKILSIRLFVGIGLISYSLYLYHWPLIAFTRHITIGGELNISHQVLLIAASFILAYLSWKFVETPFRNKSILATNRKILSASLTVLLIIAVSGQLIRKTEGYPERLPAHALAYAEAASWAKYQKHCYKLSAEDINNGNICQFGDNKSEKPRLLFWGDSHAAAYLPAVKAKAEQHKISIWHASDSACPPISGAERPNDTECSAFNSAMLKLIDTHNITDILLSGRWASYIYGASNGGNIAVLAKDENSPKTPEIAISIFTESLDNMLSELRSKNVRVWITKQVPWHEGIQPAHELTKLAMRGMDTSKLGSPLIKHQERQAFINRYFDSLAAGDNGINVLDPIPYMCTGNFCPVAKDGTSLYKDEDHLSVQGSEIIAELFEDLFKSISSDK